MTIVKHSTGLTVPVVSILPVANRKTKNSTRAKGSTRNRSNGQLQPRSFPIPRFYEYTGRYFDNGIFLDPGIASPAWQIFNLSSLFDPDTTGTGHQPIGFDQLMGAMYDHYVVHHAQVRVHFASQDSTYPQLALLALEDKSGTSGDAGTVIENGRAVSAILGPRTGGSQVVTLDLSVDHSVFFARSVLNGDKYQGTSSSSPSEGVFLHVGLQGPASVNTAGCYIWTEITYNARLSEPAIVAQS